MAETLKVVKKDRERFLKSLCMKVVLKVIKNVTAFRITQKHHNPKKRIPHFVDNKAKRANLKTGVSRKQSTPKFSEKRTFFTA